MAPENISTLFSMTLLLISRCDEYLAWSTFRSSILAFPYYWSSSCVSTLVQVIDQRRRSCDSFAHPWQGVAHSFSQLLDRCAGMTLISAPFLWAFQLCLPLRFAFLPVIPPSLTTIRQNQISNAICRTMPNGMHICNIGNQ